MARAGGSSSGRSSGGGHSGRTSGGHSFGSGRSGSSSGGADIGFIVDLVLTLLDLIFSCIDLWQSTRKEKVIEIEETEISEPRNRVVNLTSKPPYGECNDFVSLNMCKEVLVLLHSISNDREPTQYVEFFNCTVNRYTAVELIAWLDAELERLEE